MSQPTDSDLHEAIDQLRLPEDFPGVAIDLLRENWERAAVFLLEEMEDDLQACFDQLPATSEEIESEQLPEFDDLLFQATYLFGQFRHAPAFPVMMQILDLPLDTGMLGDFLFEGLPRCLASCAGGRAEELLDVLRDHDADESARVVAWDALLCLLAWGELEPEAVRADLEELLGDPSEAANEFLRNVLLGSVARLPVGEATLALARSTLDASPKGGGIMSVKEFESERASFQERSWRLELVGSECPRVLDAAVEIEPWFSVEDDSGVDEDGYDADGNWVPPEPVEQLRSDKVGRNDPLPVRIGDQAQEVLRKIGLTRILLFGVNSSAGSEPNRVRPGSR